MTGATLNEAYLEWTEHRFFRYRGCAPDPENPRRAAGNPALSLDAWMGEDRDGSEPQADRARRERAAVEVCLNCPVMVACDRYANSVGRDGKLVEPTGIRGGRTALERHKALIAARQGQPAVVPKPAPDRQLDTPQKRAILAALAVCWEPVEVMVRAEMPDVRTANWQRSALVRLLGLPKTATRMQVLEAARARGRLDGIAVVVDDGSVPAIPPATEDVLREVHGQGLLWPSKRSEIAVRARRGGGGRGVRARSLRRRFSSVPGQTDLVVVQPAPPLAEVLDLFAGDGLGAAA
jgi:hypothetical protein